MKIKRNIWILIGVMVIAAAMVSGFILLQPTAEDILVQMIENDLTITDAHAIVTMNLDSIEQDGSGTVEIWAARGEDTEGEGHHGAFRLEVLEASEDKAQGAIIVSDGITLWAYSPSENKVLVGTPEEAKAMMENMDASDFMGGKYGEFFSGGEGMHPKGEYENGDMDHPENAQEAVSMLQEYVKLSLSGTTSVGGETAHVIKMEPLPEQMPVEFMAIGGYINLWVGEESNLPLGIGYTGGTMGEFSASVVEYQFNTGLDAALFTFEIPADAEIVSFADMKPQSLTLDEARNLEDVEFQTPAEVPAGATLVDILEVRGAIVQHYTLPEGGSFTIAQGTWDGNAMENGEHASEAQSVDVRGTTGQLLASEEGDQVLLTWTEGDLFFTIAGDLSVEDALSIAESLK